jgi:hypothetical protein
VLAVVVSYAGSVAVVAGNVSVFVPATAGACTVTDPDEEPE